MPSSGDRQLCSQRLSSVYVWLLRPPCPQLCNAALAATLLFPPLREGRWGFLSDDVLPSASPPLRERRHSRPRSEMPAKTSGFCPRVEPSPEALRDRPARAHLWTPAASLARRGRHFRAGATDHCHLEPGTRPRQRGSSGTAARVCACPARHHAARFHVVTRAERVLNPILIGR